MGMESIDISKDIKFPRMFMCEPTSSRSRVRGDTSWDGLLIKVGCNIIKLYHAS